MQRRIEPMRDEAYRRVTGDKQRNQRAPVCARVSSCGRRRRAGRRSAASSPRSLEAMRRRARRHSPTSSKSVDLADF
jgi:hypothetical protein